EQEIDPFRVALMDAELWSARHAPHEEGLTAIVSLRSERFAFQIVREVPLLKVQEALKHRVVHLLCVNSVFREVWSRGTDHISRTSPRHCGRLEAAGTPWRRDDRRRACPRRDGQLSHWSDC